VFYFCFTNKNTAALRDERLYVMVFVMVFVDLCVSTLWIIVSPFNVTEVPIEMKTVSTIL